jgi:hypothetical protein
VLEGRGYGFECGNWTLSLEEKLQEMDWELEECFLLRTRADS